MQERPEFRAASVMEDDWTRDTVAAAESVTLESSATPLKYDQVNPSSFVFVDQHLSIISSTRPLPYDIPTRARVLVVQRFIVSMWSTPPSDILP
jgi:hypothetical protein